MVAVDRKPAQIHTTVSETSLRFEWPTGKGSSSVTMLLGPTRKTYVGGLLNDVGLYNNVLQMIETEKAKGAKADTQEIKRLENQLAEVRGMLPEAMRP